jgi:ribosomal protein L11 methyltransferase
MTKPEPECWQLSIPCTRANYAAIEARVENLITLDNEPTIVTHCPDDDNAPDVWVLDAYFPAPISPEFRAKLPKHSFVPVYPQNWVTLSQQGVQPIDAGRFYIHTEATAHTAPKGKICMRIEAGQAFGTGQHATTTGCLLAIDALAKHRTFKNALDIGTGTGILGFAAAKVWRAQVLGTDIDPLSIEVSTENAAVNRIPIQRIPGGMQLHTATGVNHAEIKSRAPYDLIIANILAMPLITLAAGISPLLAPGGILILAGLLSHQEVGVRHAYTARGLRFLKRHQRGDWPTLVLQRGPIATR